MFYVAVLDIGDLRVLLKVLAHPRCPELLQVSYECGHFVLPAVIIVGGDLIRHPDERAQGILLMGALMFNEPKGLRGGCLG